MTVTVKKIGGSVAVVIPKAVAREMRLAEGTSLAIIVAPGGQELRMRRQPRPTPPRRGGRAVAIPRRSMAAIVAQIKPASYRRRSREVGEGGRAVGKELW